MKKILLFLALGCALVGCRSDMDLNNIDAKVGLENTGIALPLGYFRMHLQDMIGDVNNLYVDSGKIVWKMDTAITRDYHSLDLAKYVSSTTLEMPIYDKVKYLIGPDGKITTLPNKSVTLTVNFPIILKLDGINDPDSLKSERLDSALIEHASFASTIKALNGLPLDWKWIDKVTLDLGTQLHRTGGNVVTVYQKGDNYGYGDSIPIDVENFSMNLMKNTSLPPSYTNVLDSCQFDVNFTFTIPADTSFYVPTDAAFGYKLNVRFIDYTAIWGMFAPSSDMADENKISLGDNLNEMKFLTTSQLPFANPTINIDIKTQIAGALMIDSAYLYVTDQQGQPKYAEFGPNRDRYREYRFKKGEYLPLESPIGAWTDKMKVNFDSTPDGGRIHELFTCIPKELGYRFRVGFNQLETSQIRVTPNTSIKVAAHAELPFVFNQGIFVNYPDTFHNINLTDVSLDSIAAKSSVIDTLSATQLKAVMVAKNKIPLHVKVAARCYDEKDQMIMDPDDSSKPFLLFKADTVVLDAPKLVYDGSKDEWVPTGDGGTTTIIASLTQKEIDVLTTVKAVSMHAIIDDKALKDAYDAGMKNIHLTGAQDVTIKIGVSGQISTVLDLN